MPATRKIARQGIKDVWLYRYNDMDYGPVDTDKLLDAITERKVDLTSPVNRLKENRWTTAAEYGLLRDHYDRCHKIWAEQQLTEEADRQVRKLERRETARSGAWKLGLVGILVAGAVGTWIVMRLLQAEPVGFEKIVRLPTVPELPQIFVPPTRDGSSLATVAGRYVGPVSSAVAVAASPTKHRKRYDTSGVRVGNSGNRSVTKMSFNEDGDVAGGGAGLSSSKLSSVVGSARTKLFSCAKKAAMRNKSFKGTTVGFTVNSQKIGDISVGSEVRNNAAFKACVKSALRRVSVPKFSGPGRRASVPIKIEW